jgi:hypothetical protein
MRSALYAPRARFGSYIQHDSLLDPETRELAIMRTAYMRGPSTASLQRMRKASAAGEGPVVGAPGGRIADRRLVRISTYSGSAHRDLGSLR